MTSDELLPLGSIIPLLQNENAFWIRPRASDDIYDKVIEKGNWG